jgi:hypothetical protein
MQEHPVADPDRTDDATTGAADATTGADVTSLQRQLEDTRLEVDRLKRQADQLAPLAIERDQLAERLERMERSLQGERERNQLLRFQRDRYRHQAASLQARRWWRLGKELVEAKRNPKRILLLPLALLRVLFGPGAKPDVPEPLPPGEERGESTDVSSSQLVSPTETRPTTRLEARFLLPPVARSVTDLRIAAVVDTFTESSLEPDCHLQTFRPDTWRASLDTEIPHLLFVESAWKGNGGSWEYQVGSYSYPQSVGLPELTALVERCRQHDVPTVFWNKEDPVHFDKFKEAAQLFDIVLTTDSDRIPAYEALPNLRADIVAALPFAAQPVLHHPTRELPDRDPRPVFGGTYYKNRHPERREQMEQLLDAARAFDLLIFDRTFPTDDDSVGFPDRFRDHVQGGVPYDEMVRIYRDHRLFLNTNSVIASPTMFSRRVFELLACGTPVVSTPSLGVREMFGDIVPIVETADEATEAIRELLTDDEAWQRRSTAGIRAVLGEHTYRHRLARVAALAGYPEFEPYAERTATVLLLDDEHDRAYGLCTELVAAGSELRVMVGTDDPSRFGDLKVATAKLDPSQDERTRWRQLAGRVDSPFVVLADPLSTPEGLADLVHALRLTDAGAVGFRSGGPAWTHVDDVATSTIAVRRSHVLEHGWDTAPGASAAQQRQLRAAGILPYSLGDPAGRTPVRTA